MGECFFLINEVCYSIAIQNWDYFRIAFKDLREYSKKDEDDKIIINLKNSNDPSFAMKIRNFFKEVIVGADE